MTQGTDMEMTPCDSSQVTSHGYDPVTGVMAIQYKSGGLYHYSDVSPSQYKALADSKSIGKHIHTHVKGSFDFEKQEKPHHVK